MIKATFRTNDNIDITSWSQLLDFLKRKNVGYKPVKATCFTESQLETFMNEAPETEWLDVKVIFANCLQIDLTSTIDDAFRWSPYSE